MKSFIHLLMAAAVSSLFAIQDSHAEERTMNKMQLTSPVISPNGMIPSKFTCDGADVSPPLSLVDIPDKTRSLALVVDDPDAPAGTWVHWVVWNIPATVNSLEENRVFAPWSQGCLAREEDDVRACGRLWGAVERVPVLENAWVRGVMTQTHHRLAEPARLAGVELADPKPARR